MIVDGNSLADQTFEADVCVVGAGAAGITLALNLARQGVSVLLVESGGMEFSWRSHKLLEALVNGELHQGFNNATRERFFGGTTNHWGGVCRPLDAFEFEAHPWVAHSGWPVELAQLQPYFAATADWLGLDDPEFRFDPAAFGVQDRPRLAAPDDAAIEPVVWQKMSRNRVRMGQWQREAINSSEQIRCVLNTTVVDVAPNPGGQSVTHLTGRTFAGRTHRFTAADYVLCTGAIENARLLLAADSADKRGLGNSSDVVGRYFMSHGGRLLGYVVPDTSRGPSQEEGMLAENLVGWCTSPQARTEHKLLGFMAFLFGTSSDPLPGEAAIQKLHPPLQYRAYGADSRRYLRLLTNIEQSPNPDSRVTLSKQRDRFGVPRPDVHINYTAQDLDSQVRSAELLSLAIARSGMGRLYTEDLGVPLESAGGHLMGTTRMSADSRDGVVDANCRVHDVDNLYMGGSSVFATSGWQHPTFNIIAFAMRLADHLAARRVKAQTAGAQSRTR